MNRNEAIDRLQQLVETDYKAFNKKIIPTEKEILGVRLPALRTLAKEIAKGNWREFAENAKSEIYEEIMLHGLVICYAKMDLTERMQYIAEFVPLIDNWAICDSVCGTMKFIKKHREEFWQFIQPYLKSEQEFELRFAVVILMDYYIDDDHIEKVLQIYDSIKSDKYYVQMAVAWGISVCFVKYPDITMDYLHNNNLDNFTYNKALQKITESLRVDKATKSIIRSMKRKS